MRSNINISNRSGGSSKKVVANYEDILVQKYLEELHSKNK